MLYNPDMAKKEARPSDARSEAWEWIKTLLLAVFTALIIRMFIFEVVVVKQSSMFPTLEENQKLGLLKTAYWFSEPDRGDIVVIKISKGKDYVKRVIGLPGETIEIRDSRVYIDGELLEEDYLRGDLVYPDFGPVRISEGAIFVLGDNRPNSVDSRSIGEIKTENVKGRVIFRLRPFRGF